MGDVSPASVLTRVISPTSTFQRQKNPCIYHPNSTSNLKINPKTHKQKKTNITQPKINNNITVNSHFSLVFHRFFHIFPMTSPGIRAPPSRLALSPAPVVPSSAAAPPPSAPAPRAQRRASRAPRPRRRGDPAEPATATPWGMFYEDIYGYLWIYLWKKSMDLWIYLCIHL